MLQAEGRGIVSRWGGFFQSIVCFQPHYSPGVDSDSNTRNLPWGKEQPTHLWTGCLNKMWEPWCLTAVWTSKALHSWPWKACSIFPQPTTLLRALYLVYTHSKFVKKTNFIKYHADCKNNDFVSLAHLSFCFRVSCLQQFLLWRT
jgi:hypothetical protein